MKQVNSRVVLIERTVSCVSAILCALSNVLSALIFLFSGDLPHEDGAPHPENPPSEVIKHRRLFSRGVGNRHRGYKVKKTTAFLSDLLHAA